MYTTARKDLEYQRVSFPEEPDEPEQAATDLIPKKSKREHDGLDIIEPGRSCNYTFESRCVGTRRGTN